MVSLAMLDVSAAGAKNSSDPAATASVTMPSEPIPSRHRTWGLFDRSADSGPMQYHKIVDQGSSLHSALSRRGGFNRWVHEPRRMRMFPLGSVLFPRGLLPMTIFEPRYLLMINEAMAGDSTIGVVLIERGSEVGGGDVRFSAGTSGRIVRAGFVEDDRMAIVVAGLERVRVLEWLDDDPYPCAMVVEMPDKQADVDLVFPVEAAFRSWRRLVALASELGLNAGNGDVAIPEDPVDAIWALCSMSALEQLDRQRLLETDEVGDRADRLRLLLDGQSELLEARLSGGFG